MRAAESNRSLAQALWRIYRRPGRPRPWTGGGNLPWDEPDFSQRMLQEHLDQSHGAASRVASERAQQIDWLWQRLNLAPDRQLLDVTCGPGLYAVELARRGCRVTGVDFSPAAVAYARDLAKTEGVAGRVTILHQDIRQTAFSHSEFEAALFLYGQLAVFRRDEAQTLLAKIYQALRPGGRLVVELLDQAQVDKTDNTWWFTDDTGLWGARPFLHLGERFWNEAEKISIERYHILHLETGHLTEITLCDQTYAVETMVGMMEQAGFGKVAVYPTWDGLPLYDAGEWIVYLAEKEDR